MTRRNGKAQTDRYNGHEAHCCKCRQRCTALEDAIREFDGVWSRWFNECDTKSSQEFCDLINGMSKLACVGAGIAALARKPQEASK